MIRRPVSALSGKSSLCTGESERNVSQQTRGRVVAISCPQAPRIGAIGACSRCTCPVCTGACGANLSIYSTSISVAVSVAMFDGIKKLSATAVPVPVFSSRAPIKEHGARRSARYTIPGIPVCLYRYSLLSRVFTVGHYFVFSLDCRVLFCILSLLSGSTGIMYALLTVGYYFIFFLC